MSRNKHIMFFCFSLGGLVQEHFLICPIEHHQSSVDQPQEVLDEISKFKDALNKFYNQNGKVAVFFERNYKTSHMQLQVIPIPKNATKHLKDTFMVSYIENIEHSSEQNCLVINENSAHFSRITILSAWAEKSSRTSLSLRPELH